MTNGDHHEIPDQNRQNHLIDVTIRQLRSPQTVQSAIQDRLKYLYFLGLFPSMVLSDLEQISRNSVLALRLPSPQRGRPPAEFTHVLSDESVGYSSPLSPLPADLRGVTSPSRQIGFSQPSPTVTSDQITLQMFQDLTKPVFAPYVNPKSILSSKPINCEICKELNQLGYVCGLCGRTICKKCSILRSNIYVGPSKSHKPRYCCKDELQGCYNIFSATLI